MLLAFMAVLCITQSGCCFFFTRTVWGERYTKECPGPVRSVRVSPDGDLCVTYAAYLNRRTLCPGAPFLPRWHNWNSDEADRAIILMHDDLRRLSAGAQGRTPIPWISAPREYVLPTRVTKLVFDKKRVTRLTATWRELSILRLDIPPDADAPTRRDAVAQRKKLRDEARKIGAVFESHDDARGPGRMRSRTTLEVPDGAGGRIVLELPTRDPSNWPTYPRRVLLTPPALALDIVLLPPTIVILAAAGVCYVVGLD